MEIEESVRAMVVELDKWDAYEKLRDFSPYTAVNKIWGIYLKNRKDIELNPDYKAVMARAYAHYGRLRSSMLAR